MSAFFLCSYPLAPGSVVEPGNWGRILRNYGLSHPNNCWMPLREYVFEGVRLKSHASKPSRLTSLFLFETIQDAQEFQKVGARPFDLLYEVVLLNPSAAQHRGCLNLFDNANQGTLADLEARAEDYWTAATVQRPELVCDSAIKILRRL
jgi:hypothetical protein